MQDNWNPTPYRVVHRFKTKYMEFNWQMVVVPLGMSPEEKFVTQENQTWFKMNLIQKLLRTAIRVLEDGI